MVEFDDALKSKVNREVGRINGELCDLREQEESLKVRRARLEVEMRQALALRDMFDLLGRLARQPRPDGAVHLEPVFEEVPSGPKFVAGGAVKSNSIPLAAAMRAPENRKPSGTSKPDSLPPVVNMITQAFQAAAKQGQDELALRDVLALVRNKWWPDASRRTVSARIRKMCIAGLLEKGSGVYRLNGHG